MSQINELRKILFKQLNNLKDIPLGKLDKEIERSRGVIEISKAIIETAKVENEFLTITGNKENSFLLEEGEDKSENNLLPESKETKHLIKELNKTSKKIVENQDFIDNKKRVSKNPIITTLLKVDHPMLALDIRHSIEKNKGVNSLYSFITDYNLLVEEKLIIKRKMPDNTTYIFLPEWLQKEESESVLIDIINFEHSEYLAEKGCFEIYNGENQ